MATVRRFAGCRVVIYPRDHPPAHVHVIKAEKMAKFLLNCPEGPVNLHENYGFSGAELRRIEKELNAILAILCAKWEEINGDA